MTCIVTEHNVSQLSQAIYCRCTVNEYNQQYVFQVDKGTISLLALFKPRGVKE